MTPPIRHRPHTRHTHPTIERHPARRDPVVEQTPEVSPTPAPISERLVRPIPGLDLAFFTERLAPPTTSVAPTSPLFRPPPTPPPGQVQGLQPIGPPQHPVPESPPRTEEERLERQFKIELRRLRALVQTSRGRTLVQAQSRLQRFEEVDCHLGTLKIHGQTRRILRNLLDEGHRRLIRAAVHNNNEDLQQGARIATAVENYHRIEERSAAVVETVIQFYPPTTTRGIRLEYTGRETNSRGEPAGRGNYEPPLEVLQNLTIVRTYQALSHSERAMAEAIQRIVSDIQEPHIDPGLIFFPDDVEGLERETTRLQGIYGAPANPTQDHLGHFLARVHQTQLEDLERNPAYQNRQVLQRSLRNVEVLARSLQILERNTEPVSEAALNQTSAQLLQMARRAHERMTASLRQLEARRPPQEIHYRDREGSHVDEIPNPNPTREEQALRARLERLNGEIQQLEHFDATSPEATGSIQRHMRVLVGYEEEIVQLALREEARLTGDTNFARALEARLPSNPLQRLEYYRTTLHTADVSLLRQTIQSRITMYRSMISTVQSANRSLDRMHLSFGDTTGDYTALIARYEHARALVDANHIEAAQRELTSLEQAQIGTRLQDRFETSGHINLGVSLGVMAAAAFTMNVAGLTLLPELALSAEAANAAWTTRLGYTALTAPIFRVSHNIMHDHMTGDSTVWDPTTSTEQNVDRYGRALIGDIGTFMTLGTAMRRFQAATQTQAAQGLGTRAALWGGAFGTELAAVQAWGFLDVNFQNALEARFAPLEALNQTVLNPHAWQEQAVFILGMRAGHSLTNPLFGPINSVAREAAIGRVRAQYDHTMTQVRTAGEGWRNYVEQGQGNPMEILRTLESALAARQRLGAHPALHDLIDPQAQAQVQQDLAVVRSQLERERENTPSIFEPILNPLAQVAFMGAGPLLGIGMGGGGVRHPGLRGRGVHRTNQPPLREEPVATNNTQIIARARRFFESFQRDPALSATMERAINNEGEGIGASDRLLFLQSQLLRITAILRQRSPSVRNINESDLQRSLLQGAIDRVGDAHWERGINPDTLLVSELTVMLASMESGFRSGQLEVENRRGRLEVTEVMEIEPLPEDGPSEAPPIQVAAFSGGVERPLQSSPRRPIIPSPESSSPPLVSRRVGSQPVTQVTNLSSLMDFVQQNYPGVFVYHDFSSFNSYLIDGPKKSLNAIRRNTLANALRSLGYTIRESGNTIEAQRLGKGEDARMIHFRFAH